MSKVTVTGSFGEVYVFQGGFVKFEDYYNGPCWEIKKTHALDITDDDTTESVFNRMTEASYRGIDLGVGDAFIVKTSRGWINASIAASVVVEDDDE